MGIVTVGIDTAKSVFAVHGMDEAGKVQLRQPKVARAKLNALMAELPPCTIGLEACTGAHYWARQFQAHGHAVKLMAPKLVAPYRMSGNLVIGDLLSEVHHLDERIGQYDSHIRTMARQCTPAQQLMQLMGIGEVTATALVATVGNAREFGSSRQFAARLGLVPGQYSSGGKTRPWGITKAGDAYLRGLLVFGARAVLNAAASKNDSLSRWAMKVAERRGYWKAVVAIAAKNARMAWAVLTKAENFKMPA